jgi:glutamate-1-semialdehyde 2,1-aminomutase
MATYGKSVAGGFPLSVLIGLPEIMERVGTGEVQHGGSFNSNVMVMSAARASLAHIAENPEGFYNDLNGRGMKLMQGLNAAAEEAGIPMLVQGLGSTFWTTFTEKDSIRDYREHAASVDDGKYAVFAEHMLKNGVRLSTNARWHMSSAHSDADIAETLEAARASLKAMAG